MTFDDKTLGRLSEYLDGTLLDAERQALEKELAENEALRGELEAYRRTDQLVRRAAGDVPALDWTRFTIEARDRRERADFAARHRRMYRIFQPLAAAAALALVLTSGYFFMNGSGGGPTGSAVVSIGRAGGQAGGVGFASAQIEVRVSRALPDEAVATVGPATVHKTVFVSVGSPGGGDEQNGYDELDPMF